MSEGWSIIPRLRRGVVDPDRILIVNGIQVVAPTCPVCGSNDRMYIRELSNCWVYWCDRCLRPLDLDDVLRGDQR